MIMFSNDFDFKCAIFDMDGTLLDSMPMWHSVSDTYLRNKGFDIKVSVWDEVKRLTETETALYFQKKYGVTDSLEKICEDFEDIIYEEYSKNLQLKEGAREFLEKLNEKNIPCVLATATNRKCVMACLERLGITHLFKGILTCLDLNTSKHEPLIFLKAAEICGAKVSESVVFEDALHCIRTAKKAGFRIAAVHDASSDEITDPPASDWERIIEILDDGDSVLENEFSHFD